MLLDELRTAMLESGLTTHQFTKLSGLSRPCIQAILNGNDCKMSTYETIKQSLEDAGYPIRSCGNNKVGNVNGNRNVINQTQGHRGGPVARSSQMSTQEQIELIELRVKAENYDARIADKDALIAALNKRISDLESKDYSGTKTD